MANLRTPNKDSRKEMRMQLVGKYRKSNCEIDETTSWPDGLDETCRFLPFLRRPVRRTDSADDIQRYKDYFSIARKNQGITWKHYCNILLADLLNSDVTVSLNKQMSIQPSGAPARSHVSKSAVVTRSASSIIEFQNHKPQKRAYLDINTDVESISSLDDVKAIHTPPKNVLKKMCTEIRSLAQKTCKTVEKMTTTTKYCEACGSVVFSTTVHKKCSKQRIVKTDCNRPLTPGMLKSANLSKKRPMCFQSPSIKTPCGAGVLVDDGRSKRLRGKTLFQQ